MAKSEKKLSLRLDALHAAEAEVERLRQEVFSERDEKLRTLHESFGFDSILDLIAALDRVAGRKEEPNGRVSPEASAGSVPKHTKHQRIAPKLRAEIIQALKAGETGVAVVQRFGISMPAVHTLRKEAGLVKSRNPKKKSRGRE